MNLPYDLFTPISVSEYEAQELVRLSQRRDVLEVGSWLGCSAIAMAMNGANIVHSIDWHEGDPHTGKNETLPQFWENVQRYNVRDKVVVHVGKSEDILPVLRDDMFDFIFIDAYHTYESCMKDIELSLPLLRRDGILAVHDYGVTEFVVTQAVDELFPHRRLVQSLAIIWG